MRRGTPSPALAACALLMAAGCALGGAGGASDRSGLSTTGADGGTDGSTGIPAGSSDGGSGGSNSAGASNTGGTGSTGGAPPATGGATLDPAQPASVHFIGRFVADPAGSGGFAFAWSASTIIARFSGPTATLTLNEAVAPDAPVGNYFDVAIDGGPASTLVASHGQRDYVVAQGLGADAHEVIIRRRTEARVGASTFVAVTAPGGQMLPFTRSPTRAIWIIGDSISAGYGIEGASSSCAYSPATESASEAFGVVAADALGADVQVTAWAGQGVYRDQYSHMSNPMPVLAQRTLPADPNSTWDPTQFVPQVVVIALGTNDFNQGVPPQDAFTQAYAALIARIRASYPDAYVICVLGPMLYDGPPSSDPMALSTARAYVQAAISKSNDARVSYLEFATVDPTRQGCAGHPNVAAQADMGAKLTAAIRALTGW